MRISDWSSDVCSSDLLAFGDGSLLFIDSPGHARHHFSVWDAVSRGFFTGDTFGLSYREFDTAAGPFVMPTTTPVQFDPDAWRQTLDRYLSFAPQRMFLTHYSQVQNAPELAQTLRQRSEEHTSELQSLMRTSYAVFCLKKNTHQQPQTTTETP